MEATEGAPRWVPQSSLTLHWVIDFIPNYSGGEFRKKGGEFRKKEVNLGKVGEFGKKEAEARLPLSQ